MSTPATLPANFFESKKGSSGPPQTLPANFDFKKGAVPSAEDQRPDATAQAQAVIKNAPMNPSYSALAVGNSPSGADPHNPGNPNLNAVPQNLRQAITSSLAKKQAGILAGEGLGVAGGAVIGKLTAPTLLTESVATGLFGPDGQEIVREGIKYGPSAIQKAAANPAAKKILQWVGSGVLGTATLGGGWKALKALGIIK